MGKLTLRPFADTGENVGETHKVEFYNAYSTAEIVLRETQGAIKAVLCDSNFKTPLGTYSIVSGKVVFTKNPEFDWK